MTGVLNLMGLSGKPQGSILEGLKLFEISAYFAEKQFENRAKSANILRLV